MPIKTTVIGSFPAPRWLQGGARNDALRDAIMVVLKSQEIAGIDLLADGELTRFASGGTEAHSTVEHFLSRMGGMKTQFSPADMQRYRLGESLVDLSQHLAVLVGEIADGSLDLIGDYRFSRPLTRHPMKFTCTGPQTLCTLLTDRHYGSKVGISMGVARVLRSQMELLDADMIQIDEPNIRKSTEDAEWAVPAINHVLEGVSGQRALHICPSDSGTGAAELCSWQDLLPSLNQLEATHLLIGCTRSGYEELEALKELEPRIRFGIGVVDVLENIVETPDLVAKRLEEAIRVLGPDRVDYVHPDCGLRMLHRNIAEAKMRALVEGRDLFEGKS